MPLDAQGNLYAPTKADMAATALEVPDDMAATVPLDYWKPGQPIAPEACADRLRHLKDLADISDGDTTALGSNPSVQANYWGRAASFLAALFSAFPPTIDGAPPQIAVPLQRSLRTAMAPAMYDVVRFGTGLLRLRIAQTGRPALEHVDTQNWFPSHTVEMLNDNRAGDAIIAHGGAGDDKWAQILTIEPGKWELDTYDFDGDNLKDQTDTQTGESSQLRPLVPIALTPAKGEWGRSAYIDLTPMAAELGRRFSSNSTTLDRYAMPMLVVKGRAAAMVSYEGPEEMQSLQAKAAVMSFDDGRQEPVWMLPEGIDDVGFVQWDAQQQASFSHIDRVEDAMFAMSALPYGIGRLAEALASGASLRRLWLPTYVLLEELRNKLVDQLADAVAAAGEMLDTPVDPDTVEINWPNPLDTIDEQRIIQGGPEDMGDPADTGNPPGGPE